MLSVFNLTMLFGAIGFAVDMGFGQFRKHAEQAAADAAALAAASYAVAHGSSCASGVTCNVLTNCTIPSPVTTPFGAGCVYAQANGYTNGNGNQTVTMKANNTGSPVTGNSPSLWFQATVGDSYATIFGNFANLSALSIHASAVAGVSTTGGASCIVALAQGVTAFTDSGSGNVTTSSCGIYDNGNFVYTGSGNITAQTIQYMGTKTQTGSGTVSPAPT